MAQWIPEGPNVLVGRSLAAVILVCPVHAVIVPRAGAREGVINAVVDLGHVVAGLVGVEVATD